MHPKHAMHAIRSADMDVGTMSTLSQVPCRASLVPVHSRTRYRLHSPLSTPKTVPLHRPTDSQSSNPTTSLPVGFTLLQHGAARAGGSHRRVSRRFRNERAADSVRSLLWSANVRAQAPMQGTGAAAEAFLSADSGATAVQGCQVSGRHAKPSLLALGLVEGMRARTLASARPLHLGGCASTSALMPHGLGTDLPCPCRCCYWGSGVREARGSLQEGHERAQRDGREAPEDDKDGGEWRVEAAKTTGSDSWPALAHAPVLAALATLEYSQGQASPRTSSAPFSPARSLP